MKKILIVEDDRVMVRIVEEIVRQNFSEFEILESVGTIENARAAIHSDNPDLVILDINLPDGTAFDLLRKIELLDFKVVFMSGNEDYQKEAIQFSAVSFVIKPFDYSDLILAIDKACDAISESDYQRKLEILLSNYDLPACARLVVFPTMPASDAVPLSEIEYGEAIPGGCIIHIEGEKDLFVPRPLRRYEQLFDNYAFFRCHPQYVVNLRKVESVDEYRSAIYLKSGIEIPLDPRKYEVLKERYNQALA
ncbi:LytR/AlgR family response regulator transcription factor [Marinilabilia rubra]|uniref:DNA-binding response regulator n=1 Tax=Marinilabilia rubra TaxID=2162893 RepID=A0A2U2BBT6_9BACT|nr:LytTR family DNA-binding domain-containing protein [Marinilabilia rubra]PWE00521.1 DNA-binding response regulator [Marinilabilia rubra]